MTPLFKDLLEKHTPTVNPHVMEGLACSYMKQAEQYIDTVLRSASKSFPEGLEYAGYERCTPQEEFDEVTRPKNNRRTFDLARSDLFLVKYFFKFQGVDLGPRYIYLPFVSDGGLMHLGGALYHVTPVLSDKVISPGYDSIFVRLLRDKITFKRCYHSIVVNGIREVTQVVWSSIYRKARETGTSVPTTTRANTCLMHYLLARYGFTETFKRYAGFVPIAGVDDEINDQLYPKDKWVICESSQIKPKTYLGSFYNATRLRLAIPIEHWNSSVQSMVAGFYYTVDHFPDRITRAHLDHEFTWMILLGHIIFSGVYSEGNLFAKITEHFTSLSEYVDQIVVVKLREIGYEITDFYDLLFLVMRNFNEWVVQSGQSSTSMFGKTLEVLYYVLYDITAGIFRTNFRLNKLMTSKKANGSALTSKDIIAALNRNLKMGAIYGLASGKIVTGSVSYSGDHMYPKITSILAEQESLPGATRGRKKRRSVNESHHFNPSMYVAGSLLFFSKSNPSPTTRCNPFVNLDMATATILPTPDFTPQLEKLDRMFRELAPEDAAPILDMEP